MLDRTKTKKQTVYEMMRDRPITLADIVSTLGGSTQAAHSLIQDVAGTGIIVNSRIKRGVKYVWVTGGPEVLPPRQVGKGRSRARSRTRPIRRQRITIAQLETAIVRILRNNDGAAFTQHIKRSLEVELPLDEYENTLGANGNTRWWNRCNQARRILVLKGIMKSDSPIGYWELAS